VDQKAFSGKNQEAFGSPFLNIPPVNGQQEVRLFDAGFQPVKAGGGCLWAKCRHYESLPIL
jgi:hypothetical protein